MKRWILLSGAALAAFSVLFSTSLNAGPALPDAAAQHADRAKAFFDEGFYGWLARGNRSEAQARFELAVRENRRAVELNPNLEQAHRQLARIYHVQKRYDEEIGARREVLRLDPSDVDERVRLADVLTRERRFPEALVELRTARAYTDDPHAVELIDRYIEIVSEHL